MKESTRRKDYNIVNFKLSTGGLFALQIIYGPPGNQIMVHRPVKENLKAQFEKNGRIRKNCNLKLIKEC